MALEFTKSIGTAAAVIAIGACVHDRGMPATPTLPVAYQAPTRSAAGVDTSVFAAFGSPELDQLIQAAGRNNQDLASAVARVEQAAARARQAGAAVLPQVDADLSATQYAGGSHGATAHETDWSALLSASYELDFWGKNRALRASARASADADRANLATARTTVLTAVAATYFKVQSLRERIALARLNLDTANDLLKFIESRHAAGLIGPADLAAQRAAVANAELVIPQLEQQEAEALGTLAVLTGQAPEGFALTSRPLDTMAEPAVAAGMPAQLLQRRPDLMAAEYALRAAHADVIAARAALFPSFNLTASGGVANPAVQAAVITLAGTGYSLTAGADVVQTLFDNGRRRAVTQEAAAREAGLLAAYRGAILSALLDVETALGEIQHLDSQQRAQRENVAQSELALKGAQLRYREGATEVVAVLEAQRTLSAAREQRSEYQLARLNALLSLSKALGGSWQTPTDAPLARVRAAGESSP